MWQATRHKAKKIIMEVSITNIIIGVGVSIGSAMLAIIGFFLIRLVKSIDGMAKDIGEIKVSFSVISTKHDALEDDHLEIKQQIKVIHDKVFT